MPKWHPDQLTQNKAVLEVRRNRVVECLLKVNTPYTALLVAYRGDHLAP